MFAWHMKLRDKKAELALVVRDPINGGLRRIERKMEQDKKTPVFDELLYWQYDKMNGRPDMILQYAHHVARKERRKTGHSVEVRAVTWASLNGRPPQTLIDPAVDLAKQPRSLWPATWILPLDQR